MRASRWIVVSALLCLRMAVATPSLAGSICGTVRDALTTQPVAQAALFLFDNLDQYTGLYAGSDVAGQYCINNVTPGTYTLQVKVDDYIVAVVPGIVVTETPTGVNVDLRRRFALDEPWPNPASGSVSFRLQAPAESRVQLDVFDAAGRRVYGWDGTAPQSGERTIQWNLQDFNHTEVQSGIYFVRLRAANFTAVRRFVRLR
ncbi:MAG TPA: carboxypeptidase regulatory-like domain-containing protein [Candidatus Krumholzibacteria bacterium]|nr:carboxypeptidase regulatory-like domain-containing protein [Candidatus Krumholzibacteria bacterium]